MRAFLLASVLLVLGVLLVLLVTALGYSARAQRAEDLVDTLTSETAQRVADAAARLANEPALAIRAAAVSMSHAAAGMADLRELETELMRVATLLPGVSSLRFVSVRGTGVSLERRTGGGFTSWLREGDGAYRGFEVSASGDRAGPIPGERDIDLRELAWFRASAASRKHAWSTVQLDATGARVVTFSVPVAAPGGALAGVIAADLDLAPLGELLRDTALERPLLAYAMERDGGLVGVSREKGAVARGPGERERTAIEMADALVAASAAEVLRRVAAGEVGQMRPFRHVDLAGQPATIAVRPVRIDDGPGWVVVVVSPRDPLAVGVLGPVTASGGAVLAFVLAILALGTVVVRRHRVEMRRLQSLVDAADRHPRTDPSTTHAAVDSDLCVEGTQPADELQHAVARLRTLEVLVEQSGEAIILGDTDGRIEFANRAFERLTGYSASEVRGLSLSQLHTEAEAPSTISEALATVRQRGVFRGVLASRGHADREFFADVTMSPVESASGEVTGFVAILRDATDRVRREAEIHYLAKFDTVTRLPNRVSLLEHMQSIARAGRRERDRGLKSGVLYIDLDKFKPVNDRFGHDEGDRVLAEVADRLRSELRADDMVARVGGDEFVAVLGSVTDLAAALKVANKIIEAIEAPILGGTVPVRVTASVGLAMYPDHATDAFYLIKLADAAMYVAKEQGGSRVAVCRPGPESDVTGGRYEDSFRIGRTEPSRSSLLRSTGDIGTRRVDGANPD